jgi:HPr kinase/phosphorylase
MSPHRTLASSGSDASLPQTQIRLHASAVAWETRGLLILGGSGAGKSALALTLMAYGAQLVSDDRTILTRMPEGAVTMSAPAAILGRIEARGIGILAASSARSAVLSGVVDLDEVEAERLPELRSWQILGTEVPLFHKVESPHFAPALVQYLKGQRVA